MNFGIVGCGFIAKKHAIAIQEVENANLVAVSDKITEAMQPYAEKYGAATYEDLDEMLKEMISM